MRSGDNVLAVEVHQSGVTSSDLVFDLGLNVVAIPIFFKYAGNPVVRRPAGPAWNLHRSDPSVLRLADGSWVMYYTADDGLGNPAQIGRAVSSDGINWTLDASPILVGQQPAVLFDGTTYRLWYTDTSGNGIRLATSTNGQTFTLASSLPVLQSGGGWEASVFDPTVVFDGAGYRMWYMGFNFGTQLFLIGYATSPDGVTWSRNPSSVGGPDFADPYVMKDGDEYKMWVTNTARGTIIYGSSFDGIDWARFFNQPSLTPGLSGSWDQVIRSGAVVRDGAVLKMWYSGLAASNGTWQMGYATH